MTLPINPETKVGALLDAYPGIEEILVSWVPAFSRLKNPILRKTVAKVATLDQAARLGGINVRDLVRKLREATGQGNTEEVSSASSAACGAAGKRPTWLDESRICAQMDADRLLENGEHPIGKVRQCLSTAAPGQIIRLTSSFLPAPLIDTLRKSDVAVWATEDKTGCHTVYITRLPTQPEIEA